MSEDFEYKVTTIKTSGYTRSGNVSAYWESEPKEIDMSQYIPIEWVKKYRNQFETTDDYYNVIDYMLRLWEKENETC